MALTSFSHFVDLPALWGLSPAGFLQPAGSHRAPQSPACGRSARPALRAGRADALPLPGQGAPAGRGLPGCCVFSSRLTHAERIITLSRNSGIIM